MQAGLLSIADRFDEAVIEFDKKGWPRLRDLGDCVQLALCRAWWGRALLDVGRYQAVRAMAERCLELGRELNNGAVITAALPVLAIQALLEERYKEACGLCVETPAMAGEAGDRLWWVKYGGDWAAAELLLGRRDAAQQHLCTALRAAASEQGVATLIRVLPSAAAWLAATGQTEWAVKVYALASSLGL